MLIIEKRFRKLEINITQKVFEKYEIDCDLHQSKRDVRIVTVIKLPENYATL